MDSPVTALSKEYRDTTTLRVLVTLRGGESVDGVALDGDDNELVLTTTASATPVHIPISTITAVAVRERSRAREWTVALSAIVAFPMALLALASLPFEIPEDVFKWIIPAIIIAGVGVAPRAMKVPVIERTLHRWREVYRDP